MDADCLLYRGGSRSLPFPRLWAPIDALVGGSLHTALCKPQGVGYTQPLTVLHTVTFFEPVFATLRVDIAACLKDLPVYYIVREST